MKNLYLSFNIENRSSIYLNNVLNSRGYGVDIFAYNCDVIDVIVDTFTVLTPTDYYASPIDNFTFDIQNCIYQQVNSDLYVSPDGNNSNSGTSPDDPLKTIIYALSVIYVDSLNQHTIFLLPGIYSPSTNEEQYPLPMSNYVSLQGNSQEDTFLDADSLSGVLRFDFVIESNIRNITIRNGNCSYGGGIYCYNSNPDLTNVTINGNTSQYHGGGIYFRDNSSPSLENVTISNNSAMRGSGIYCDYSSNPSLENVTITGNSGSAFYCNNSSNPSLMNVTITNNLGGGIRCDDHSNPSLENIIITGNSGYGISCGGNSNPCIENVTITDNSGFGIGCGCNSNPTITNVTITGNSSPEHGGGVSCSYNSDPCLTNVIIAGNSASDSGGGIYCYRDSSPSLTNVTITDNSALRGGGIYCERTNLIFNTENRCSVYLNNITNTRGFGADIFAYDCDPINVIVDTFTVLTPTDYYASPIGNFTFDILHAIQDTLINSDFYVSVAGDDSNTGTSPDDPLQTIRCALSKIYTDSLNQNTIYLAAGIYSTETTGEVFPIEWSNFVSLEGSAEEETILDANNESGVMKFNYITSASIGNVTIRNGYSSYGGGIDCRYSNPNFTNVILTGNSAWCHGGGIHCYYSSPYLENVTISGSSAERNGGGIYCRYDSSPTLRNVK